MVMVEMYIYTCSTCKNKTFIPGIEPAFANFEKLAFKTKPWFAKIEKLSPASNLAPK
jgi:hypothetical protein